MTTLCVILSATTASSIWRGADHPEHGTVHDSCGPYPDATAAGRRQAVRPSCVWAGHPPAAVAAFGRGRTGDGGTVQAAGHAGRNSGAPGISCVCEHGLYTLPEGGFTGRLEDGATFSPGLWDFAEYALYHTEEDPRETADVKARYPEVLARMQALEAEWLEARRTARAGPACTAGR